MLLQVGEQHSGVVRILGELLDELVEGFLLRLQPLHPDDQVAEWDQVTAKPRGIVPGVGGVDLELLHGRQLRA